MTSSKDFIEALGKGLQIIEVFETAKSALTMSEVAELVGMTRAAARRYLLTLVELGYAYQEDRHFMLTPKVLVLSRTQLGGNPIFRVVQSALDTIAGKTGESASAAVLNGSEIIFVARAQSPRPFSASVTIGTRLPALRTAMGKVLLSELHEKVVRLLIDDSNSKGPGSGKIDPEHFIADMKRVKAQRYATSVGELQTGLNTIAVPLHHPLSQNALSLGLSLPENKVSTRTMVQEFLPELRGAVTQVMLAHK
jgi:IclR family pca regulon transcriptional regulator